MSISGSGPKVPTGTKQTLTPKGVDRKNSTTKELAFVAQETTTEESKLGTIDDRRKHSVSIAVSQERRSTTGSLSSVDSRKGSREDNERNKEPNANNSQTQRPPAGSLLYRFFSFFKSLFSSTSHTAQGVHFFKGIKIRLVDTKKVNTLFSKSYDENAKKIDGEKISDAQKISKKLNLLKNTKDNFLQFSAFVQKTYNNNSAPDGAKNSQKKSDTIEKNIETEIKKSNEYETFKMTFGEKDAAAMLEEIKQICTGEGPKSDANRDFYNFENRVEYSTQFHDMVNNLHQIYHNEEVKQVNNLVEAIKNTQEKINTSVMQAGKELANSASASGRAIFGFTVAAGEGITALLSSESLTQEPDLEMGLKQKNTTASKNAEKAFSGGVKGLDDAVSSAKVASEQGVIAIQGVAELSEEIIVLLSMPDIAGFLFRAGGNSLGKIDVNGLTLDFTPGAKHFLSLGGITILGNLPVLSQRLNKGELAPFSKTALEYIDAIVKELSPKSGKSFGVHIQEQIQNNMISFAEKTLSQNFQKNSIKSTYKPSRSMNEEEFTAIKKLNSDLKVRLDNLNSKSVKTGLKKLREKIDLIKKNRTEFCKFAVFVHKLSQNEGNSFSTSENLINEMTDEQKKEFKRYQAILGESTPELLVIMFKACQEKTNVKPGFSEINSKDFNFPEDKVYSKSFKDFIHNSLLEFQKEELPLADEFIKVTKESMNKLKESGLDLKDISIEAAKSGGMTIGGAAVTGAFAFGSIATGGAVAFGCAVAAAGASFWTAGQVETTIKKVQETTEKASELFASSQEFIEDFTSMVEIGETLSDVLSSWNQGLGEVELAGFKFAFGNEEDKYFLSYQGLPLVKSFDTYPKAFNAARKDNLNHFVNDMVGYVSQTVTKNVVLNPRAAFNAVSTVTKNINESITAAKNEKEAIAFQQAVRKGSNSVAEVSVPGPVVPGISGNNLTTTSAEKSGWFW